MQKRLGFAANAPRWAIAHKFSANSATSEIINIEIQIGRTGALTPVAKIKPINIGDLVKLDAEIIKVGVSSLRIKITVNSENLIKNSLKKNCECFIVFVAIDENGNKIKINN